MAQCGVTIGSLLLVLFGALAVGCSGSHSPPASPFANKAQANGGADSTSWKIDPAVSACLQTPGGAQLDPEAALASQRAPIDSWFVVSNVQTEDGRTFNFVSHIMHYVAYALSVNSITDAANNWYSSKEYDYFPTQMHASTQGLSVETPDATLIGTYEQMHLTAKVPGGAIDVHLSPEGPALFNCNTGFMSVLTAGTYEYALPKMKTTGVLTINGVKHQVSGVSWLDRQWVPAIGELKYINHKFRWTWMNLNMDNGDFISLWDVVDNNKNTENAFATVLHPDGTHITVPVTPVAKNATDVWTSSVSGRKYPTHFIVEIPSLDTRLEVTSKLREQEIVSMLDPKYEGASEVKGIYMGKPAKGFTYVEMVGDWK